MVTRGQRIGVPSLLTDRTLYLACLGLVLTLVCVQADLSRCLVCQVLWAVESLPLGYKSIQGAFQELWRVWLRGRQRNRGFFSDLVRGVSNACEGSKILSFLFRFRLVCSSLLHLRSSWTLYPRNII
jgi:hypothetical protein